MVFILSICEMIQTRKKIWLFSPKKVCALKETSSSTEMSSIFWSHTPVQIEVLQRTNYIIID